MSTFLLIRHGSTEEVGNILSGRKKGVPLNGTGRKQALQLVRRLRSVKIDAVYTSPLDRAMATGGPLATKRHLPLWPARELNEIDYGAWTGRRFSDLEEEGEWIEFNQKRGSARPPGGETLEEVRQRTDTLLRQLHCEWPDGVVALVTHSDVVKTMVLSCLGAPLDSVHRLEIALASVTVLEWGAWVPRVIQVNHLGMLDL